MIDVAEARRLTPGCAHVLHLNNAGASLMPQPVLQAVKDHLDLEARVGGYEAAALTRPVWERPYTALAQLLNCQADEIALIENATRAWDMAMYAILLQPGDRVLTASNEYSSNWLALLQLARRTGCTVELVPNNEHGEIDTEALASMLDDRVKVVALTHVAASNGMVQPAAEVGRIVRAHSGAIFLLDACQSTGQLQLDVKKIGCHILSGTGRKFLRGPRGTGFLYVCNSILHLLEPPFVDQRAAQWVAKDRYEWLADARRFENWETSYALRIGLGVALDHALRWGMPHIEARVQELAALLRNGLGGIQGLILQDTGTLRSGIVTFTLDGRDVFALQKHLVERGMNITAAPVAIARLDLEPRGIPAIARASVHYFNTMEEIERFVAEVDRFAH
jgi:cysteine desulfurase / selenocysteine lyase